ncbi:MAG: small basic family protein [Anaerovibrio sp.]|uniref:small basic family protein n=1 Tax=Anaerovibrio sp. TaxID=1872532 RepID=UPI0025DF23C8|nr:small basic family protein [Anaerovibrio sp.]MCR5175406.1 small basic family protein [Anaerovibrio sp.]
MIYAVIGLLIGMLLGFVVPWSIPVGYSGLFSVALMASLDTVFGGLKAACNGNFDDRVFITGFFTNALLAAFLVYVGDRLGMDLYYVALLAFGLRIFNNLGAIRHYWLQKH